ncbi:MAG: UbiA family prenyltransferase [Actinobacteria bacterium]|nr:UbiA family prenyltransferase [Actinomycetota bacterium]
MMNSYFRLLRPRQWVKNLLIFVPVLAAHRIPSAGELNQFLFAFAAISFCASTVYVINDLFDVESDKQHPVKQNRPIAAGEVSIKSAWSIALTTLVVAFSFSALINQTFSAWLAGYFAVTLMYTFWLKKIVLVDCFTLAALYTLRILAGAAVVGVQVSFWLLACSGFLFLSLAFAKRYGEIAVNISQGREYSIGRGYKNSDSNLILSFGVGSGLIATLVLALYVNSASIVALYRTPIVIWGTVPILLLWIFRIWLKTHRGEIADDPLLYATKDPVSIAAGLLVAALVVIGAEGWIV